MIGDLKFVYAGAWRYMIACPLLFAVPVAIEFIQHIIEMRIGMYESIAAAQAVEAHGARLGWGLVKTMAIGVAVYWVARFLVLPGGAARAARLDPRAVRLYLPVMLWTLGWTVLLLWGGDMMTAAGLGAHNVPVGAALMAALFVLDVLLAPWKIGAALGNEALGFARSILLVGWRVWWGLIFSLIAILPPMIAHYALGFLAMGASETRAWLLLAADSVLVGYLAAILAATAVAIARDALRRSGTPLAAA